MAKAIGQYQLIRQIKFDDFNLAVKNFLKDGWEPRGDVMIREEKIGNIPTVVYYQVMMKA
jgi:hypothetical protein